MSEQTKVCTKCGATKPLPEFKTKIRKTGRRPASSCKECDRAAQRDAWAKKGKPKTGWSSIPYAQWTDEMREKHLERKRDARRSAGAKPIDEFRAARSAAAQQREIEGIAEKNARQAFEHWLNVRATDEQVEKYWAARGDPWRNARLTDAEQYAVRYATDVEFQIKERMRRQVRKAKNKDGIAEAIRGAIRRNGESRKVEVELGYSIAELMRHIEKQFTKGMSWERFRAGEIHIDHITPQAAFDLTDDDEWRRCWCLSNLRPLWAKENLEKRDAIVFLL